LNYALIIETSYLFRLLSVFLVTLELLVEKVIQTHKCVLFMLILDVSPASAYWIYPGRGSLCCFAKWFCFSGEQ